METYNIAPQPDEDADARTGWNWQHYLEAFRLYHDFVSSNFADALRSHGETNPGLYTPPGEVRIAEANELLPVEGYLSFYCDLLGFSSEIKGTGTDSLPDYYGAAFVSASENPAVKVYLLSDTCVAFAPVCEASSFLNFVSSVFFRWLADGMLPQCFIGHGSFVERRPDFGPCPANFFGTQVTGTALVDAVDLQKEAKPLGSRILLTQSAWENLPNDQLTTVVMDKRSNLEFLPKRGMQFDLFDCLYYLLCLRGLKLGGRVFDHYAWSYASRALRGGRGISVIAQKLATPCYGDSDIGKVLNAANAILEAYKPIQPRASSKGADSVL